MSELLVKPPYGAKCNRCGQCCKSSLCIVGEAKYHRTEGPCPALELDGDGPAYRCGMMARPKAFAPLRSLRFSEKKLRDALAILIGSDTVCDAWTDGEEHTNLGRDLHRAMIKRIGRRGILEALALWNVR